MTDFQKYLCSYNNDLLLFVSSLICDRIFFVHAGSGTGVSNQLWCAVHSFSVLNSSLAWHSLWSHKGKSLCSNRSSEMSTFQPWNESWRQWFYSSRFGWCAQSLVTAWAL